MSSAAIVVLIMVVVSVAIVLAGRNAKRQERERAEEYRKAASLRGWQLEFDGREYRYGGTTDGIPWTAHVTVWRRHSRQSPEPMPLRWQTAAVRFDEGALIVWPGFGEAVEALGKPGVPDFVLQLVMRPVTWALGVPGTDAAILARATSVVEGPQAYLFRATDEGAMREWLAAGAADALEDEAEWLARHGSQHLVTAVLWKHGLQIATAYGTNDFDHIARVARTGAALARSAERARTKPAGGVL